MVTLFNLRIRCLEQCSKLLELISAPCFPLRVKRLILRSALTYDSAFFDEIEIEIVNPSVNVLSCYCYEFTKRKLHIFTRTLREGLN